MRFSLTTIYYLFKISFGYFCCNLLIKNNDDNFQYFIYRNHTKSCLKVIHTIKNGFGMILNPVIKN